MGKYLRKQYGISIVGITLLCLFSPILFISLIEVQYELLPFVVATAQGPGKLDPLDAYDSESIKTIMQVCEGLYQYNYSSPEMECIPCLAEEMGTWNPSADILTVPLKQGVTFHDGTKFNASAVKWNFDRLQYWTYGFDFDEDGDLDTNPAGTASMTVFKQRDTVILNRTEILDEYTVRFVLNLPSANWENLLAFIACSIVLPDLDENGIPYYGDTFLNRIDINDELIGTGPFMLTDYEFDNQVVFDYYPDYHLQWGDNHIERMIYLIIPDDVTSSLAVLNYEVHWGGFECDWYCQFNPDPNLVRAPVKGTTVYYVQMNLYNMPLDVRLASSFAFNFTFYLAGFVWRNFELHVPIPDGMQYHLEGFEGEPEYDVAKAQEILLNSADAGIAANITFNNLGVSNTTAEWRAVAESTHPVAWYNFTRYSSATVLRTANQLKDNLKDIGIRVEILPFLTWANWVQNYLKDPAGHHKLAYSFEGWGLYYNDPINMIEPLYGTNASENCFGLNNATWNQKLLDTYVLTGDARRDMFWEIQQDFCKYSVPSFYILQAGSTISFNRVFVDEDSVADLLNIFGYWYWFNIRFTPPEKETTLRWELILPIGIVLGISLLITITLIVQSTKRKRIE